jgi:NADH dehydrogenase
VFALGDVALVEGVPGGYPMVAPVAIQQAEYFVRFLNAGFPEDFVAFSYRNQGSMATIGRRKAVVEFGHVRFKGWVAWNVWMFVHLMSLVGFKNRLVVLFQWALKYFSHKNIIRLIVRPYHTVRPQRP